MIYILISIITISVMYIGSKVLEGVDKLFDYWERKRNERKM